MKVYLDMCCYNRPYDPQDQIIVEMETQSKLHIQERIKDGELALVTSYTLDYEVSRNPFEMRQQSIIQFMEENATEYVGTEREKDIRPMVLDLMSDGVKEKDAYHIATAIFAESITSYLLTTGF